MQQIKRFIICVGIFSCWNQTIFGSRLRRESQPTKIWSDENTVTDEMTTVIVPKQTAQEIITHIASQPFLPYPYSQLKQDPVSGLYVLVSSSTYTFFNAPNDYTDTHGNPVQVGAIHDSKGNLCSIIQGAELASLSAQYGIVTDTAGNQYLGICTLQPIMLLDAQDLALKPGQSGQSMICSDDPRFPSPRINSPMNYKTNKFYFYYNFIMQTYFVMQVNGSAINYINMQNGCMYNLDGSNQIAGNPVGTSKKSTTTDFFLPYLNTSGDFQCLMEYNGTSNTYSDFINTQSSLKSSSSSLSSYSKGSYLLAGVSAPYNNVTVSQKPSSKILTTLPDFMVTTQYNISWDEVTTTIYTTNPSYQWFNLKILPIDMNNRTLSNNNAIDSNYDKIGVIFKNNNMYGLIFGGQFFSATQLTPNSYTLSSPTGQMVISINTDSQTNVKYLSLTSDIITCCYQYQFLALSKQQLQAYQAIWQLEQIASGRGTNLLIKRLPTNDAGYVQLSPVTKSNILNFPSNSASQNLLNNIRTIAQDTINNRFLTMVYPSDESPIHFYDYITQHCYADLANGILFDTQGIPTGQILQAPDLDSLLANLSVVVVSSSNKTILSYSQTPSSMTAASTSSQTFQTPSFANNLVSTSTQTQSNSPIYQRQQQNSQLQADIALRQTALNSLQKEKGNNPNVKNQIQINQNAITVDQQQIAANNTLISSLQASAANPTSQSRSTLLGRMKSNKASKKNK